MMMKHMDEINKANLIAEDAERTAEEAKLRKSCKTEIDELGDVKGPEGKLFHFLKLLEAKYPSYSGEKVKFTEEALQSSKLKTTLREAMVHYHPDKKSLAVGKFGDDQKRQEYLRDEIIKIINLLLAEVKL